MKVDNDLKEKIIKEYFSELGKKGGAVKGVVKLRGDSDYYKKMAKLSAKKRKKRVIARNRKILEYLKTGAKLKDTAKKFNVSIPLICNILGKNVGLTLKDFRKKYIKK